jgi:hypothetical protein
VALRNLQIAVYQGRQLRSTHPLDDGDCIVGRGEDCDIVVRHESVSRQHVRLNLAAGILEATDMDTPNGTFINEQRVPSQRLLVGDRIELGSWSLRVEAVVDDGLPPLPPVDGGAPSEESTMRATAEEMAQLRERARDQRAAHLVWAGANGPASKTLGAAGLTIGFGPDVDLQLNGSALFAKGVAEVRPEGTRWAVVATSSLVPIKVAGQKVKRQILHDGDTLEIKGQRFRFRGAID